jgi:hypothetical protein
LSFILTTCPAYLILADLTISVTIDSLEMEYNFLLYILRHRPFSFTGPIILRRIFLSYLSIMRVSFLLRSMFLRRMFGPT